jgi:signal peptidase I
MSIKTKNILATSITASLILTVAATMGTAKIKGIQLYTIDSSAMAPALQPGDLAIATKTSVNNLIPGDVITYKSTAQPQPDTKRIMSINRNTGEVRLVSDNQTIKDEFVSSSDILGKNVKSLSLAGYVLNEVRRPEVLIGLIYIPLIWILLREGKKLARAYWRKPYSVN